ncbi:Alpha/Beta hydrolase protein [Mycena albidolilacea]|uniref:Alpha/Beta hydrolase protein n=1 Tax=Mycena albidolilacea TaxID=1033008 RepID=A0AAD7AQ07_9AGAR|nr:Alpha/Beta hydrolase protein [Mycena albidolilacea]
MINSLSVKGLCLIAENGTVPNPDQWTGETFTRTDFLTAILKLVFLEHLNLIMLDHPVGASASYGTQVNNSCSAAIDVYDFLQKFLCLFPDIAHGSYCSIYVPHIAMVSHCNSDPQADIALAKGKGLPGAAHINLELMMASNPISSIQFTQQALEWSVEHCVAVHNICQKLQEGNTHENKDALGIPEDMNYHTFAEDVTAKFWSYGDRIQPSYLLYGPLLKVKIWLLHESSKLWPVALFPHLNQIMLLRLLQLPFQDKFLHAPDVPWPTAEDMIVRVVSEGTGNMTYILVTRGGHFVAKDQPTLVKSIVKHWAQNIPFV